MYLRDVWESCLRRWYLLIGCVLFTVVVVVAASSRIDPEYQLTADVVLIPPPNPDAPKLNRYLGLGGLGDTVDVLARSMSSEQTTARLQATAPDADYTVAGDPTTSAPLLIVEATSHDPARAADMLKALLKQMPVNLAGLQRELGIRSAAQITAVTVARDQVPTIEQKARIRILAVIEAGLLFLSLVGVAAADGVLLRRSSRRAESARGEGAPSSSNTESTDP